MITATEIQYSLASGLFVTLDRGGRVWRLPVLAYQGTWLVVDRLWPGDHLTLPEGCGSRVLVRGLVGFAFSMCIAWAHTDCPACGVRAAHHIDVPADIHDLSVWAVNRTCIRCGHSWRTEAAD